MLDEGDSARAMGHSTELVKSKIWKRLGEKKMFSKKIVCMQTIISKVHISSNCAVNSHIVFSGTFWNICPLPKFVTTETK